MFQFVAPRLFVRLVFPVVIIITFFVGVFSAGGIKIKAEPNLQYQDSEARTEATLEFGWMLYSRQLGDSNYRVLIVAREDGLGALMQCRYNATNTDPEHGVDLSDSKQLPNGNITYDFFIERTVEEAAQGILDSIQDQSVGEILGNFSEADISDLAITDIHGSIAILPDRSLLPSILC